MARQTAKTPPRPTPVAPRKRSAHDRAGVTESMEDYLECIFDLERSKGYACVSDVAEALSLNRASTSIMVKRLGKLGFLRYDQHDHHSDIEGIEHHLSERAFRRFAELAAHLRQHPFLRTGATSRSSSKSS
jgi:Mn-dependent DtxR family transcriptional regulator